MDEEILYREALARGLDRHDRGPDLLALDAALDELQAVDPELARIVELRFFGGFKHEEIAALDNQSKTTVRRRWRLAKAWLHRRLAGEAANGP